MIRIALASVLENMALNQKTAKEELSMIEPDLSDDDANSILFSLKNLQALSLEHLANYMKATRINWKELLSLSISLSNSISKKDVQEDLNKYLVERHKQFIG